MATRKPKPSRSQRRRNTRSDGAARVRRYRDKQRASGLRLVQMWLPDTSDPRFIADVRRQCRILRNDPQEEQVLNEMLSVADLSGWK